MVSYSYFFFFSRQFSHDSDGFLCSVNMVMESDQIYWMRLHVQLVIGFTVHMGLWCHVFVGFPSDYGGVNGRIFSSHFFQKVQAGLMYIGICRTAGSGCNTVFRSVCGIALRAIPFQFPQAMCLCRFVTGGALRKILLFSWLYTSCMTCYCYLISFLCFCPHLLIDNLVAS